MTANGKRLRLGRRPSGFDSHHSDYGSRSSKVERLVVAQKTGDRYPSVTPCPHGATDRAAVS